MSRSRLPRDLQPMKAVTGDLPQPDEGWAYEVKWDGMRLLAFVDPGYEPLSLRTTRGHDAAPRFPEVAGLEDATRGLPAVLDGEIVALDDDGRPSFGLLQGRMHVASGREAIQRANEVPVVMMLFDVLFLDTQDTTPLPYLERRQLLDQVVEPDRRWSVPKHQIGDGQTMYDAVAAMGLEGVIAKRTDSVYEPGRRSRSWRKVKVRNRQEFVVGGWLPGEGGRAGRLGALLVGYHDEPGPPGLRYAGRVGTGFDDAELQRLGRRLDELARPDSPFVEELPAPVRKLARFVEPEMVVEVVFGEWTADGRLRHPAYCGEQTDKDPERVVREPG